jgi:carboxymethylenebutenolidase
MCEQDQFEKDRQEFEQRGQVTRRQFGMMIGAGVALMLPSVVNAAEVTESEITITTPDGVADCYFVHPSKGTAPAIIIWPDIFGLRPAFKKMGKRLAESGYAVLVVNPFYRSKKAADMVGGTTVPIAELRPLASALNETTAATDSKAFVSWLDAQPSVSKNHRIGTQGYCMGGSIAFRTAAAVSDRIGAVASFHGGGLVSDKPTSPHLIALTTKAHYLVAIAENDDARAPTHKTILKETFEKAGMTAEVEVYAGAAHGWCPPDSAAYNEPLAEKAWAKLLALYQKAL